MKDLFSDKVFYKKLLSLTLPIAFQSLMLASVAAADAIMLGRVEQNAMSAVSLATQIQFIQNMMVTSFVCGITILGAQYWGKGDKSTMEKIFCMALRVCGLVSLLFCIGCEVIPQKLMLLFTNEPVLIEIGAGYLRIAGWSYLLTGISQCYLAMMKVTEHAGECAVTSTTAVILNIILNAVFIFGLFGLPVMGVRGAALATLIARIVELIMAVIYSSGKSYIRPSLSGMFRFHKLLAGDFYKCVLPLLGGSLLWGVGYTSYTAVLGHMGTDAAAANSVAAVVRDLICCACNGVSAAAGIVIGNELGSGNLEKGKLYGDRIAVLSFIVGFGSTILVLLSIPLLESFIILTDGAKTNFTGIMWILSLYMIGRAVNTIVINGVFAAGGDTLFDMYSLVVAMWLVAVPLSFLGAFVFHWSVYAVYFCTCIDEVGKIPWVMAHYKKYKWVKDLTRTEV